MSRGAPGPGLVGRAFSEEIVDDAPASLVQRRLHYVAETTGSTLASWALLRVEGGSTARDVTAAVRGLVDANPVLGSALVRRDGVLRQTRLGGESGVLTATCTGATATDGDRDGWVARLARTALPADGRLAVFWVAEDDGLAVDVVARLDHCANDADSVGLLASQLCLLLAGGAVTAPQYSAFSAYQTSANYRNYLDGLTSRWFRAPRHGLPYALPTDARTRPAGTARILDTRVEPVLAVAAARAARAARVSLFSLYGCALALALRQLGGGEPTLAIPQTLRRSADLARMVGVLVNVVPWTPGVAAGGSGAEVLRRAHAATSLATALGEVPYETLTASGAPGLVPAPEVLFQTRTSVDVEATHGTVRVRVREVHTSATDFPLTVDALRDGDGGVRVVLRNSGALDDAWVDELAASFADSLARVVRGESHESLSCVVNTSVGADSRVRAAGRDAAPVSVAALEGATETAVAAIWSETLGLPVTDASANFFELGGHSLAAYEVLNAVRARLDPNASLRQLLKAASLREFADGLSTGRGGR